MLNAFFGNVIFPFYLHVTPACNMQSHVFVWKKEPYTEQKKNNNIESRGYTKKFAFDFINACKIFISKPTSWVFEMLIKAE